MTLCSVYDEKFMSFHSIGPPSEEEISGALYWSKESGGVAIMSWARNYLSVVEKNKKPFTCCKSIHCLWLWLIVYRKKNFLLFLFGRAENLRWAVMEEDLFHSSSRGFSKWGREADNQMMELKPRIIRHHNLRWRKSIYQFITMTSL